MRFCDFFISYKIGLKRIRSTIPFFKLPFYRKIFFIVIFSLVAIALVLKLFKCEIASDILIALTFFILIAFYIFDSYSVNLNTMLNDHYKPYSESRINLVKNLLIEYGLNSNNSDSIDLLIKEAEYAQVQCDYIAPLKKPFGVLSSIIIPIVVFTAQKIGEKTTISELTILSLQAISIILLYFSFIFLLTPIIKEILYLDYNKYNDLIYDLRQIKLFYRSEK